jgi:hypothetical protein
MTNDDGELPYYSSPGPLTAVSDEHGGLLAGLPRDLEALCAVVQGVVMHPLLTALYEAEVSEKRKEEEPELRSLGQMLAGIEALDSRPLALARPPEKRLLGTCRSFSALLCGLLRSQGVPARARCGFARYFVPGRGEDHWVCEVWSADDSRWFLVDAQLDSIQRKAFRVSLDPLDVGRDEFMPGGLVWKRCRSGAADWSEFGLSAIDKSGMWFIVGDFVRDIAALNKVELLPWDGWCMLREGDAGEDRFSMEPEELLTVLSQDDVAKLDRLAEQTGETVDYEAVALAYQTDERLRVPLHITSTATGAEEIVDLDAVARFRERPKPI